MPMSHFPFKFYQHRARVFGVLIVLSLVAYFLLRAILG